MQSTTDELRNFSRPDTTPAVEVDLVKVISSALQLTQNVINKLEARVELKLPQRAVIEEGRSQRLEQVVINLITNACRAMSSVDQPTIEIELVMMGENWQLRVSDNGLGFGGKDPKVLFEAFYTTATKGNGLGLGLAISAAIVSEHHGKIWANESKSGGAEFFVELPQKA
nr:MULTISPECIES: ATP-binding protein [unclassified Marinobacterium]